MVLLCNYFTFSVFLHKIQLQDCTLIFHKTTPTSDSQKKGGLWNNQPGNANELTARITPASQDV